MATYINEEKRQTLRKLLEDMGFTSSDPKTYSPEELAEIFSTISITNEFRSLMKRENLGRRLKCARQMCQQHMLVYGNKDLIRFCSDGCKKEYIKNEAFNYTPQEIDAINQAFAKTDANTIVKLIKEKALNSKVHGIGGSLCNIAGVSYTTFKDMGKGTHWYKVLALMKAAGITLKMK